MEQRAGAAGATGGRRCRRHVAADGRRGGLRCPRRRLVARPDLTEATLVEELVQLAVLVQLPVDPRVQYQCVCAAAAWRRKPGGRRRERQQRWRGGEAARILCRNRGHRQPAWLIWSRTRRQRKESGQQEGGRSSDVMELTDDRRGRLRRGNARIGRNDGGITALRRAEAYGENKRSKIRYRVHIRKGMLVLMYRGNQSKKNALRTVCWLNGAWRLQSRAEDALC